jgi:hypothetical protein
MENRQVNEEKVRKKDKDPENFSGKLISYFYFISFSFYSHLIKVLNKDN